MKKIKVWSSLRPALYKDRHNNVRIVAGTTYKIQVGSTLWPLNPILTDDIRLSDIEWMGNPEAPVRAKVEKPSVKRVMGSNGNIYQVITYADGRKHCNCPGYQYRRKCKHVDL